MTDLEERHACGKPASTMRNREAGNPRSLAQRVRTVGEAFRERDENAAREELRQLAREALLMSKQVRLWG